MAEVRVSVRSGESEFEIECNKEDLGTILSLTDQLVEVLSKIRSAGIRAKPLPLEEEVEPAASGEASAEVPQITSTTLSAAIVELLSSPWGREPRTVKEIMDALEVNALHYPQSTTGPQLIRMTRAGTLRRLKKGDLYSYVIAKKPGVGQV